MYCHKCGKEIDDEAAVCIYCGVETNKFSKKDQNINITNKNSVKVKGKQGNALVDLIMIFCTGGLWIIWMIVRSFL